MRVNSLIIILLLFSKIGFALPFSKNEVDSSITIERYLPNKFSTAELELQRPFKFPAFVETVSRKNFKGKSKHPKKFKVGTFSINGHSPWGSMKNKYFSIFKGISDNPLSWQDENSDASNVYYHLLKAITFFQKLEQKSEISFFKKAYLPFQVRIDMDVQYHSLTHFTHLQEETILNNAATFPPANPKHLELIDSPLSPWPAEIWFGKPKRFYKNQKWNVLAKTRLLKNTIIGTQIFPINFAKVPSVIYHEFVHILTQSTLGAFENANPIAEGYSNYYAASILKEPIVGYLPSYSPWSWKLRTHFMKKKIKPIPSGKGEQCEVGEGCDHTVNRFFWSLRKKWGAQKVDLFAWKVLQHLTPESRLSSFKKAILKTLKSEPEPFQKEVTAYTQWYLQNY
ncbi:MAG: hypothetical protein CL678_18850 [Bdellovibrionaceae bacterium]|nr:hypothetical protein [Pseudobdellovibrionaceae bacterium]|tara:strand:- start:8799 stop:9989 length:1191 start_codon:yes stop_codon:yes gene_type:complete